MCFLYWMCKVEVHSKNLFCIDHSRDLKKSSSMKLREAKRGELSLSNYIGAAVECFQLTFLMLRVQGIYFSLGKCTIHKVVLLMLICAIMN
jgi:hypothetical protein